MIISPNRKITKLDSDLSIRYDNKKLKEVDCTRLLGIYLDNRLTFKKHVDRLVQNRIRKFLPMFKQLRNCLSLDNLLKTYYTNVNSLVSNCSVIYCTGNLSFIDKIICMQRRILKVLFGACSTDVNNCMKKHKILNIRDSLMSRT